MLLFALLPLVGAFFAWAPAAADLLSIDNTVAGVLLPTYGVVVVSGIDAHARPLVIAALIATRVSFNEEFDGSRERAQH